MKSLSALPSYRPFRPPGRARYAAEIREPKSEQVLVITSQELLVAHQLDVEEAEWGQGERHPDGVVMGQLGDRSYVCFIELKSSMKPKPDKKESPAEHALAQLEGGIRHFHPSGLSGQNRSHGDEHHDLWRTGEDALEFQPDAEHVVIGVAVGFRQVPRPPPTAALLKLGRKQVVRAVIPIHGAQANQATIAFDELLKRAGILP